MTDLPFEVNRLRYETSELVKDLREQSEGWEQETGSIAPESWHKELMAKAADKIERLEAENARLRAALLEIASMHWDNTPATEAATIARAALNGEKEMSDTCELCGKPATHTVDRLVCVGTMAVCNDHDKSALMSENKRLRDIARDELKISFDGLLDTTARELSARKALEKIAQSFGSASS